VLEQYLRWANVDIALAELSYQMAAFYQSLGEYDRAYKHMQQGKTLTDRAAYYLQRAKMNFLLDLLEV
jgi:hypothetical protein